MGGDEFTILLADLDGPARRRRRSRRRSSRPCAQPVSIDEHELFVTTSIGIAHLSRRRRRRGDAAQERRPRHVPRQGARAATTIQLATPTRIEQRATERLSLERSLRHALERDELVAALPADGRARHRTASSASRRCCAGTIRSSGLMPARRVHPARRGDAADRADRRVGAAHGLRADEGVARRGTRRSARGGEPLAAPVPAARPACAWSSASSTETGLPPRCSSSRSPRSTAMQNAELTLAILNRLQGDGRPHLHRRLRHRLLVAQLPQALPDRHGEDRPGLRARHRPTPTTRAIVSAVIAMARALNLRVIAEGVETEEQLAFLRREQCEEMQGFLYSQPLLGDRVRAGAAGHRKVQLQPVGTGPAGG